jgi:hypothetical protein
MGEDPDGFPDLFDGGETSEEADAESGASDGTREGPELSENERYLFEMVVARYRTTGDPPGIDALEGRVVLSRSEIFDLLDELKDADLITYDGGYKPTTTGSEVATDASTADEPDPASAGDVPTDPESVDEPEPLDPRALARNAVGDVDPAWLTESQSGTTRYHWDQPLVSYLEAGEQLHSLQSSRVHPTSFELEAPSGNQTFDERTWLLVTDAAIRFIVVGAKKNPGRTDHEDRAFEESIYAIEDTELERNERLIGSSSDALRFETASRAYTYHVEDSGIEDQVLEFVSERVAERNRAREEIDAAVVAAKKGEMNRSNGDHRQAIERFHEAIQRIESAVFRNGTKLGLIKPETERGWGVETKRPAGRRWIDAISSYLIEALDVDTSDLMNVVNTCRKRRVDAASELLDPLFERAAERIEAGDHGEAADTYAEIHETLVDLGEYLTEYDIGDLKRRAATGLIEARLSAAEAKMDAGAHRDVSSTCARALSDIERVADAIAGDSITEYRREAIRRATTSMVLTTRDPEETAPELAALLREWPDHHDVIVAALERVATSAPEQLDAITLELSRTFDGSGRDERVASVLQELLASRKVAIDETSVIGLLDGDAAETRRLACEILARAGGDAALEAVRGLQDDPVYEVRVAALRATKTLARRLEKPLTESEQERASDVEIVHAGDGDIVTGPQEKQTIDKRTTIEDSVVNRSTVGSDVDADADPGSSIEIEYCPSCGADLGSFEETRFCPRCGMDLQ